MDLFKDSVGAAIPKVIEWRRHLHQYPEPSFEEFKTTEYIIEQIKGLSELSSKSFAYRGCGPAKWRQAGPVIAFRADIDALG